MKALVLEGVQKLTLRDVPTPDLIPGGAMLRVKGNGVCRSDWHGWIGDSPREVPVVMGHEMSGVVEDVGPGVTRFKNGDRVVVPFSGGDGTCEYCRSGHSNLCDNNHHRPGRGYSGGYGEYVCVPLADFNLVHLPEEVSFTDGAALGCRFMTSYHGIVDRARVGSGEWVVVYGCGGIGLSAINIAASLGARVIGVDVNASNLHLAKEMGASCTVDSRENNPVEAVMEITKGGAHVSVDALGIAETCLNGIKSSAQDGPSPATGHHDQEGSRLYQRPDRQHGDEGTADRCLAGHANSPLRHHDPAHRAGATHARQDGQWRDLPVGGVRHLRKDDNFRRHRNLRRHQVLLSG